MDRSRFQNRVISLTDEGDLGPEFHAAGIPLATVGFEARRPRVRALINLARLTRSDRPHIVQTWLYQADALGLLATIFPRSTKLVWNIRCTWAGPDYDAGAGRLLLRLLALASPIPAQIITNSTAGQIEHQRRGYHPRQWSLIPNGVDTVRFAPQPARRRTLIGRLGLTDDVRLVGHVARHDPLKDHNTFFRFARLVANGNTGVHFVLAGHGVDPANEQIRSMIDPSIRGRVHLLGPTETPEDIFAAIDVLVSTSKSEGFPTVIAEAMSCGTPCVSTDAGDAAMLLDDETCLVRVSDADALARRVLHLLENEEARQLKGAAARERIVSRFSLGRMVKSYESLYAKLAPRHP